MGEEILTAGAGAEQRPIDQPVAWSARGNPAQMALLECTVFEVFFGGARGGGKTDGMLGEWIRHADLYGPNAIGLMLRRTRTELIETIERSRAVYSPTRCGAPRTARACGLHILSVMPTLISIRATPTRGSTSRKSALSRRRLRFSS
jgi:hypothetical protein